MSRRGQRTPSSVHGNRFKSLVQQCTSIRLTSLAPGLHSNWLEFSWPALPWIQLTSLVLPWLHLACIHLTCLVQQCTSTRLDFTLARLHSTWSDPPCHGDTEIYKQKEKLADEDKEPRPAFMPFVSKAMYNNVHPLDWLHLDQDFTRIDLNSVDLLYLESNWLHLSKR